MPEISLKTAARIVELHALIKAERATVDELSATRRVKIWTAHKNSAGYDQETARLNADERHRISARVIRDLISLHHDRIGAYTRELRQLGAAIPD